MIITLNPIRTDTRLTAIKQGDTLALNNEVLDFSSLPDGATLPAEAIESNWIAGPVGRIDGKLHLTLLLPHGANAPEETRFPEPLIDPPDGELVLPAYDEVEVSNERN